eukprot:2783353-Rhodomonas_salina.1
MKGQGHRKERDGAGRRGRARRGISKLAEESFHLFSSSLTRACARAGAAHGGVVWGGELRSAVGAGALAGRQRAVRRELVQ